MTPYQQTPKKGNTSTITKIKGIINHWLLISPNNFGPNSPIKGQAKRMDMKAEYILLLYIRNTPQPQGKTLPQSKGL